MDTRKPDRLGGSENGVAETRFVTKGELINPTDWLWTTHLDSQLLLLAEQLAHSLSVQQENHTRNNYALRDMAVSDSISTQSAREMPQPAELLTAIKVMTPDVG